MRIGKIQSSKRSILWHAFVGAIVAAGASTLVRGETAADETTATAQAAAQEATYANVNTTTAATPLAFSCSSVCGGAGEAASTSTSTSLSTPDLVVEYNWNPRVPTCSGLSCETDTCSALERKLPSYQGDEAECHRHQNGLLAAGCKCEAMIGSSGSSSGLAASMVPVSVMVTGTTLSIVATAVL
uniref:Uncharacterized protein n=1 Tax=Pseudo-nitzschia australis TaxID=44445 RepID=A0A7S4EI49_9STRA|mmetsp:Transcript_11906/g.25143  ORF Transcript_11906/g.25143 Transcript_11906/m.25143 type:complete len:185 (+) Transcript_11906:224-778(+)